MNPDMSPQALHLSPAEIELLRRTVPELREFQAQRQSASEDQSSKLTNTLLQNLQTSLNNIQSDVKDLQRNMQYMHSNMQKMQNEIDGNQKIPRDVQKHITETRVIAKNT